MRFDPGCRISVLILTKNEELDIAGAIDAVSWCDDIHVFDSLSTDRTVEIARAMGAHVAQREFDTYSAQRNAALSTLSFKHEWLLFVDCDERFPYELYEEMKQAIATAPPEVDAFRMRRYDHFLGRKLKHAQMAAWYLRLVRRGKARYTRPINETPEVDGEVRDLEGTYLHYSFSKGFSRWFEKHNVYSTMEARIVRDGSFREQLSWKTALFEQDFHKRRLAQKAIFYCLPCRPLLRWVMFMFVRGGILDGYPGFVYSTLQAFYEWMIVLKTDEMRNHNSSPEPARLPARSESKPAAVFEEISAR